VRGDLDLGGRGDPVCDALGELARQRTACSLDCLGVGIEGEHGRRLRGDSERESTVAAAELQHAPIAEVAEAPERSEVSALGVEHALCARSQGPGLYALVVVPRAPNFAAFRRVSSNLERA
jgi:hypothetical protein